MKIGISGSNGFLGEGLKIELGLNSIILQYEGINRRIIKENDLQKYRSCDFFLHLAEPAANEDYVDDFRNIAIQNSKILSEFFGHKLVYLSSVLVYGLGDERPHKESDPVRPFNAYTEHKVLVEEQLSLNSSRILRVTNLIGNKMHQNNLVNNLIRSLQLKETILVQSDNVRDFLEIQDAAKLISSTLSETFPRVVNIGSGQPKSISQIAKIISREMKLEAKIDIRDNPEQQPKSCVPDVSLIQFYNPSFIYTPLAESINLFLSKEAE